jgi:hypothetical protein
MLIIMGARRTTITLDDRRLREVSERAGERKPFELVIVGGRALIDTSPKGLSQLIEQEEIETLRR